MLFSSQLTVLFWMVTAPDCITASEVFDSASAVRNPGRAPGSWLLHFSALPQLSDGVPAYNASSRYVRFSRYRQELLSRVVYGGLTRRPVQPECHPEKPYRS